MNRIVSNTGPLITLENIPGFFSVLRQLYDELLIPQAVLAEVSEKYPSQQEYINQYDLWSFVSVVEPQALFDDDQFLHLGERWAITLAHENNLPLLIEDRAAKNVAKRKGIPTSGILGQIMKAYKYQLIGKKETITFIDTLLDKRRIGEFLHRKTLDMMENREFLRER